MLDGFTVITALSGEEGLSRLQEIPAKLVISDQKMAGGMSGTEFLTQVKSRFPDSLTMILSAFSEPEYLMDAVNNADVYQYILKPWNQDDLIHRVSQALQFYHAEVELRRLARANKRLLEKMTLMENFSLIGDFSTALYERFFPVLQASLRVDGHQITGSSDLPSLASTDKSEWSHLGTVVSRLGQLGLFYHLPAGFQVCNVASVIQGCVAEAKQATEKLGGNFNIEWCETYAPKLPELLIQVETFSCAIKALIENAVIFNTDQPENGIRKVYIDVSHTTSPEPLLSIEIRDNGPGCGLPKKVFSPLYTTCSHYSASWIHNNDLAQYNFEPYNHVGLGLFITRWCVTQHDGRIDLVNPNEPGALFKIDIPVKQDDLRQRLGS